ncbi:MAG: hypothetical protein JRJ74_14885 [Deltaproteobacteria bacterium]|nr:hypothetical protein [Deltaproteobacteria bacterium]
MIIIILSVLLISLAFFRIFGDISFKLTAAIKFGSIFYIMPARKPLAVAAAAAQLQKENPDGLLKKNPENLSDENPHR